MTACLYPGCGLQTPCEAHPKYIHEEGPVAKSRRLEKELLVALADASFERTMKILIRSRLDEKNAEYHPDRRAVRTAMLKILAEAFPGGVVPYLNDFDAILDAAMEPPK